MNCDAKYKSPPAPPPPPETAPPPPPPATIKISMGLEPAIEDAATPNKIKAHHPQS
jgi:hypothetical protein